MGRASITAGQLSLCHWSQGHSGLKKKRGLASGIAVSGMGLGTFLLVPLSQGLISMVGWQMTFTITGALVLIILLPANSLFLRHKPCEVGQYPDGLKLLQAPASTPNSTNSLNEMATDWTLKMAVLSGRFWALMLFPFLSIVGMYIILVHNVRFLVNQGIDKMAAALIFAMVGVISSIFRIFWGWLSDRIGREITFTMGILCACMGVSSLLLFESSGFKPVTYGFFLFFGMGWGCHGPHVYVRICRSFQREDVWTYLWFC